MASPVNALVCALIATAFWSLLGYALGSRLVPRVLAIGAAPVIGWSVHSAATLPIYLLFGFSPLLVAGIGAVCVLIAGFSLSQPRSAGEIEPAQTIPVWAFAARRGGRASAGGDHPPEVFRWRRLACRRDVRSCKNRDCRCDDAARSAAGQSRVWRSRCIERLGLLLSVAFQRRRDCARHVDERLGSRRRSDLVHSVRLAQLDDGARGVAEQTRHRGDLGGGAGGGRFAVGDALLDLPSQNFRAGAHAADRNGRLALSGHMGSATSDGGVLRRAATVLLVTRYALQQDLALVVTIALLVVAGFESSAFVGGIAFAVAGLIAAPILLSEVDPQRRLRFVGGLAIAALLVVCLIAPFVRDQLAAIQARGDARAHRCFAL